MLIEWNDQDFMLGLDVMDNTHREFIELVNELAIADNASFPALFDQLIQHMKVHFQQEDELMTSSKFPAFSEHHGEHQRILGELNMFKKRVDKGLIVFGRNYIKDRLPEWFRLHLATMDSATAMHLKQADGQ